MDMSSSGNLDRMVPQLIYSHSVELFDSANSIGKTLFCSSRQIIKIAQRDPQRESHRFQYILFRARLLNYSRNLDPHYQLIELTHYMFSFDPRQINCE